MATQRTTDRLCAASIHRLPNGRNLDHDKRKPWPGLPSEPADLPTSHDHSVLWQTIGSAGVDSFGEANAVQLAWPLNRAEALQQPDGFIAKALPHVGDFQDAMSHRAWRMFHSPLSFVLNTKTLYAREVVARAYTAWGLLATKPYVSCAAPGWLVAGVRNDRAERCRQRGAGASRRSRDCSAWRAARRRGSPLAGAGSGCPSSASG